MAKKSKKGGKSGGDFWDEEIEAELNPEQTLDQDPEAVVEEEPPQDNDFLNSIRSSKKKKEAKEKEEKEKKDGPKLLSKKEKEKLKKEAEKQAKKEAAAKKKADQAAKKEQIKEANKQNAAANAEKKAEQQKATSEEPESKVQVKKGKKAPAGIAALRKQLELKKQLEEEQRRLEEEEEQRQIELERSAAEKEAEAEAARQAKKEKDRLKKERLKAEGKLLTRKQREEKKLQDRRRELLLQGSGVSVAGLGKKHASEKTEKPKRVVYTKKRSGKAKTHETQSTNQDVKNDDDDVLDDWEQMLDDEEQIAGNDPSLLTQTSPEADTTSLKASATPAEHESTEVAEKHSSTPTPSDNQIVEKSTHPVNDETVTPENSSSHSAKEMRSPICCILGHVDTGKTKLLDKIRQTNVQGGEAGGITQQIGATYFPVEAIKQKTAVMSQYEKQFFDVPGLLIIDTPGHESFTNLRSRGSSLCNIAILVIDIMHGLEQQTLESIRLLRDRKAPFVVALNKIDRLFDWEATPNNSFRDSFGKQSKSVQGEFHNRYEQIKLALAEQGLNSELYFQNKNMSKYVSIVPTSAVTGEGVPDLLWLLLELTQKRMSKQLMYLSKVAATILEVKVVEGFGYTIDVVLSNGVLREGDRVVLCGLNGPIATNIRALLTPPPSRELRIKSEYIHHKEVKAALGVKIAANDLEKAVAGSRLLVVGPDDDEDELMEEVMDDLTGLLDSVDTSGKGVVVQASTLGSLEALLDFLKDMKIPVMSIGLGPVYKRDVMKATAMLEKAPELAVMLCFDVKIDKEAEQYAEEQNVKIFNAEIIYHLFDAFSAYQAKLLEARRKEFMEYAVIPCVLKTIQIINKRNPMIIGVDVIEGTVRVGTPICAVKKDPLTGAANVLVLGKVVSLEVNHKSSDSVKKGQTAAGVAMRLENPSSAQPTWGRHVDETDNLYSLISRRSIDTLKDPAFRDTVLRDDWLLIKKLKPVFDIK